jgi:hypothetical protein
VNRPPYRLRLTPRADERLADLQRTDARKHKKVLKALRFLRDNPAHPGLGVHKWEILKGEAPDGGDVWTAYVENNTPSAWRIFFFYDSRDPGLIYVTSIEPHS